MTHNYIFNFGIPHKGLNQQFQHAFKIVDLFL